MPAGIINRFVILSINRKAVSRRCGFSPAASATAWSRSWTCSSSILSRRSRSARRRMVRCSGISWRAECGLF